MNTCRPPRRAAALALLTALAGCATVAPPVAPDRAIALPAAWSAPVAPAALPAAEWWQAFGDPVLARLVAQAAASATAPAAARARLAQARALYDAAAAAWWPAVDLSATVRRAGGDAAVPRRVQAGAAIGWTPDAFGEAAHAAGARAAEAQAAEADLAAVQVGVAAEVALDYLQWRSAEARLALARAALAAQDQTLRIAGWRAQAGLGSSLDVAQSRAAVERTRAQLAPLQALAATSRHALAVLTGQSSAALQVLAGASAPLPLPPADLALDVPAQVLRQRPDVAAAERRLAAAAEAAAQADAARYPGLRLDATLEWAATRLGALGGAAAARALVLSAGVPVFDAGRLDAGHRAALAAYAAEQATYRAQVLAALQSVEDALAGLESARARTAALDAAAAAARDAAGLASQRYAGGVVDFLTVLETQRSLLELQDALAVAQADWVAGHVRLYQALGGGWRRDGGGRP